MPTSIAKITANGKDLATSTITTAWAGAKLVAYDARGVVIDKLGAMYLFPHGKQAQIVLGNDRRLPSPLLAGTYDFATNKQGEQDKYRRTITVVADVPPPSLPETKPTPVEQPPVVSQPEPTPGKETPSPASSKVVKGIVTDHLFAGDTVVILRDGTRTTHREYFALCGHKAARLWNGVAPDEEPSAAWLNERIAWAKDNGVETLILCCTPEDGGRVKPTAAKTKSYFEKLAKLLTACGFDVAVELVNEPNLGHYWAWSLAELVTLFVNPAIEVLAAAGIEIIGPSPTGEVKPVRDLIAAGLNTKKLSGMGFHLYRQSGPAAKAMLVDLAGVVGTLPIDHTELNAFVGANVRAWKVLQARPELTKAKLGRDVIDADVRKFDDRARLPARSPADAVAIQKAIWAEVVACPNSRYACYYVLYIEKETSTGPLALLVKGKDGLLYETEYSADFWRLAKVSGK